MAIQVRKLVQSLLRSAPSSVACGRTATPSTKRVYKPGFVHLIPSADLLGSSRSWPRNDATGVGHQNGTPRTRRENSCA